MSILLEFLDSTHGAITWTRNLGSQSKLGQQLKTINNHREHFPNSGTLGLQKWPETSSHALGEHIAQLSWVSCSDPSPLQWSMTLFSSFILLLQDGLTQLLSKQHYTNAMHTHANPEWTITLGMLECLMGWSLESKPGASFKNNIYLLQLAEQWRKLPLR